MSETVLNCIAYKCTTSHVMGFKNNHCFNLFFFDYACRSTAVFSLMLQFNMYMTIKNTFNRMCLLENSTLPIDMMNKLLLSD